MIGATIRLGAGVRSVTMGGHTWNLMGLSRGELSATASLLSDTMGLERGSYKPGRRRPLHERRKARAKQ